MTVLIVEDDPAVRRLVRHHLHDQGLSTIATATAAGGRAAIREQDFDIVILDLTLPDGSGLELIDDFRRAGSPVHIIVLSGAATEDDRVRALGAGADDYVVKPFSVRELVAAVLAVRRRLDPALDATLHAGGLEIDLSGRRGLADGRSVELTSKEFDLLAFLAARPGAVFSREDLLRSVWHSAPEWQQAATVTEHIRRLRSKIERDPRRPTVLHTVRGAGYRFDGPDAPDGAEHPAPTAAPIQGEVVHVDGKIVSADDAAATLLGVAGAEGLLGRHVFDFVAPGSLLAAQERMRVNAGGRALRSQLIDLRRPDGTEILVEVTSSQVMSGGERAGRIVLAPMLDPSSRLRHLATGLTSELSDAVVITDLHSHVRSWNGAAERLYGWGEHEVSGRHVLDVLHGAADTDTTSAWHDLSATGHWHGVATHLTRDGSTVSVWASTTMLRDETGEAVGVISVNRLAGPEEVVDQASDAERAEELRGAIARGELEVHYQPIVAFDDLRITTLEALVRWNHPERGLLLPAAFIGVAERSGLIRELGTVVLGDACRQAARWRAAGLDVDVAVNVSSRELADPALVERVAATLVSTGLDPAALWLEVTETGLVEDVGQARLLLDGLAALGVGIAIDDFGTGWASLTYLREFPVHALKIDGSFVNGIGQSQNDAAIVRSIVSLGAELDLFVVAEGIETEAQHRSLEALGCTIGQGFLFGRPTPASAVPIQRIRRLAPETTASPGAAGSDEVAPEPLRVASANGKTGALATGPTGRTVVARSLGAVVGGDVYDETAVDAATSMLRELLRIRTAEGAAELLQRAAALGATLVPAQDAGPGALPVDLSLGEGPPLLAVAEPFSVARLRLERLLPRLAEDARQAVALLRQTERLDEEAALDTLTGLGNGRVLDRVLLRAPSGVVIALNLDHFTQLNDCFGMGAGDQVLSSFARVLTREVRAGDTICRIGGEEFVVHAEADVAAAGDLVERLRAAWAEQAPRPVTFSAGIASVGLAGGADALQRAHEALQRAKTLGRDRTELAPADVPAGSSLN